MATDTATLSRMSTQFGRFVAGDPSLRVDELCEVGDFYWTDRTTFEDTVARTLTEPPNAPAPAPQILAALYAQIRNELLKKGDLLPDECEHLNSARERGSLCLAAHDSYDRKRRLTVAMGEICGESRFDDMGRPRTLRILAELGYCLSSEFGMHQTNKVCAQAFELLSSAAPGSESLRDLCNAYELRLLALDRQSQTNGSQQPTFQDEWKALEKLAFTAYLAVALHDELSAELRWSALTRRAALAAIAGKGKGLKAWSVKVRDAFELTPNPDVKSLEALVGGVLRLLRAKMRLGLAPSGDDREGLSLMICEFRRHTYQEAEEHRVWLEGERLGLQPEEAGRRLLQVDVQVDAVAIRLHVDTLLNDGQPKRYGLALSGGGLRAAIFHLGVLAWLAETDKLREIDVISCVSGGSIAGAAYALRLKTLLQTKYDLEINRDDYVHLVAQLIDIFSNVAQRNFRMRAFASPLAVLRLWLSPRYTFSERIAELLDLELFAKLHPAVAELSQSQIARLTISKKEMTQPGSIGKLRGTLPTEPHKLGWPVAPWDFLYQPLGELKDFSPVRGGNLLRATKVPELAFNATAVNSGSAFRFLADAHGEQPDKHAGAFSNRPRSGWLRYDEMTAGTAFSPERIPLSRAVAASASVPGIIPPILLERTQEDATLALADGGVFDNQGTDHLLEQGCTHIFVSDASGQLMYQPHPDLTGLAVMSRATDMLMERVRELNYERLADELQRGTIKRCVYVHLTKGLSTPRPAATFRPDDVYSNLAQPLREERLTSYGVKRHSQGLLAAMRTDLDCFSEIEIDSLLLSGYLQAKHAEPVPKDSSAQVGLPSWTFMRNPNLLGDSFVQSSAVGTVLKASRKKFFRLPEIAVALTRLATWKVRATVMLSLTATLSLCIWLLSRSHGPEMLLKAFSSQSSSVVLGIYALIAIYAVKAPPSKVKRWLVKFASGPFLAVAMVWAWVVLIISDPVYRRLGRVPREPAQS